MTEKTYPPLPPIGADVIREAFEKDFFADAPLDISARNRSGDGYEFSIADNAWKTWKRAWQVARAQPDVPQGAPVARVRKSGFRFNADIEPHGDGEIPLYLAAAPQGDALDAARYRWLRRKFCLTGNGDGTCAMQAINLPAAMPGWPEPGDVETFCDAAIDAARAQSKGTHS